MAMLFEELNKQIEKQNEKKRRKKNQKHRKPVDMKTLLKNKTIRNNKGEKYEDMLAASYTNFEKELRKSFQGNSKILEDSQDRAELFTNKRFCKAICHVAKDLYEEGGKSAYPRFTMFEISELYITNNKLFAEEEKVCEAYVKLFGKCNKKQIKKLSSEMKIKKMEALALLLSTTSYKDARMKAMIPKFKKFLGLLYDMEDLTEKKVIKAISACFPNKKSQFISFALSERNKSKENKNFNVVTNAILSILNKMDSDDRKAIIKSYAKNRKAKPNSGRRINLYSISEEEYKNVARTVERLIDTGMDKELFA